MKLFSKETVYRPVPSPCYEVEACESWLTDMAAQGLFVEKLGFTLARFRRGVPQKVRYRLTAARLKGGWLDSAPSEPLPTEKALYAEYGWQFVCSLQEFFLYACRDPQAPELHTDPAVQALSLKMARHSAWWECIGALVVLAAQFFLNGRGHLARFFVELPLLSCCLYLYFFGALFLAFRDLYYILRFSRRLRRGYAPDHRKDWRPAARLHWVSRGITSGALALLMVGVVCFLLRSGSRQPIENYSGPLPFATLQDLADGSVSWSLDDSTYHNSLEVRHSLLAPSIMDYTESGKILQNGNVVLDTYLMVQYYDTRTSWLAQLLMDDLHQERASLVPLSQSLPDLPGIDAAYAYADETGTFRQMVLQKGHRVISIFWLDPYGDQGFQQLAPTFAEVFSDAS